MSSQSSSSKLVLVSSPSRSGSSLTGMMLDSAGLFGGVMKPGDRWNPKGYYENVAITELTVEYLIENDFNGLKKKFYPTDLDADFPNYRERVLNIIDSEGRAEGQRWFYKNAKVGLCWRLWARHFPEAKWVIVHRDKKEIVDSLMRTDFMDAFNKRDNWERFVDYHRKLIDDLSQEVDHFVFNINRVFIGVESEIERLLKYVGVDPTPKAMECVERKLWNGK